MKLRQAACRLFAQFLLGLLLVLALPTLVHAGLPRASSVPGGVAVLRLGPVLDTAKPPRAWFGERAILVMPEGNDWFALVGLPLDLPAGVHELRVNTGEETKIRRFEVAPKIYPEQRIVLKDTRKVRLSAADEARAEREIAMIQGLKRHWREADDTDADFQPPANGRLASRFGLRRFFNGEPRSPHAGLDIAVPRGTAIKAGAHGRILAIDDYFFNGKTVFVDHGNGLISMYCHLERIDVRAGETVRQGQRLGLSGMTGRASGPHLHWSVVLNGAMVDPELFLPLPAR